MEHNITQFKGLISTGNDLNVSLDYAVKFEGNSKLSHIEPTKYKLGNSVKTFTEDLKEIYFITLDDDQSKGYFVDGDYINTYSYNPEEFLLAITDKSLYLYENIEDSHSIFHYSHISIKENSIKEYKGKIYFLDENNDFYILGKFWDIKEGKHFIKVNKYYRDIPSRLNDLEIIDEDTELERITKDITIVPQADRNEANDYRYARFNVLMNNVVIDKLLFIHNDGIYYPIPYNDNQLSNTLHDYPKKKLKLLRKYDSFYQSFYIYETKGIEYNDISDEHWRVTVEEWEESLRDYPGEVAQIQDALEVEPDYAHYDILVKLLGRVSKVTYIGNSYDGSTEDGIDTSETTEIDVLETMVLSDGTEQIIKEHKFVHLEGDQVKLNLDLSEIEFDYLDVEYRIYIKYKKTTSYELAYSKNKFKTEYYDNLITNRSRTGIYLEQTLGLTEPTKDLVIEKFDSFQFINDIMFIVKDNEVYYPTIGNGYITKNFYTTNSIPEVQADFMANVNGSLGTFYKDKLSLIHIVNEGNALLFQLKDEIGLKVKKEKNTVYTPEGILMLTEKSLIAFNGQEMKNLTEQVTQFIIDNYNDINIFYSIRHNSLFLYTKSEVIMYDLFYQFYKELVFTNSTEKILENLDGNMFLLSDKNIYELKEETDFCQYKTAYFNFNSFITINRIIFQLPEITDIKKIPEEYIKSVKVNDVECKLKLIPKKIIAYVPLDKKKLETSQSIEFEYNTKINSITIEYDAEKIP